MSVKVAVRVRPFNQRELQLKSTLCVQMEGNKTILTDPSGEQKQRDFNFDFSFWSHDSYKQTENGYLEPESQKYADQKKVFEAVGREVLDNAWNGYHCCLFAYGQTGSGKSYSMVGYGNNKGIVPIVCEEIFSRINIENSNNLNFEVQFSMMEIYNERIQDLLMDINKRTTGGLKIREHKSIGIYVDGLGKYAVDNYKKIESKMVEGNRNRTIGATLMNANSSRAHTIIQIEFKQIQQIGQKKTTKLSVINLVDLAGSEKLGKTGAQGDRLKEGCSINKSLSVLGQVISILADKSIGKGKNLIVPYRDSVLTRILQNALGGNSKTLMICALSPASYNYEETLSTLRYADQAKKIKNHAVVNESEQDKMIRELQDENKKLKEMLQNIQNNITKGEKLPNIHDLEEMQDQLEANNKLMKECERTFQQKLENSQEIEFFNKIQEGFDYEKPFLVNLSEDPVLDGKIQYSLSKETINIGKKNGTPVPDIILGGIGISPNHAIIQQVEDKISIKPASPDSGEFLFLNGLNCYDEQILHNNDRIIMGTNSIFLIKIPCQNEEESQEQEEDEHIDWEFAQAELMKQIAKVKKLNEEEYKKERQKLIDKKIKEVEQKLLKEKENTEKNFQLKQQEYEQQIRYLQEKMKQENESNIILINEKKKIEKNIRNSIKIQKQTEKNHQKQQENQLKQIQGSFDMAQQNAYIEHKFTQYIQKIIEVNYIAKELKRDIIIHTQICLSKKSQKKYKQNSFQRLKLQIQVYNREIGAVLTWNAKKFTNRYYIIKEILEKYFENEELPKLSQEEDPFWDPPEPVLIGQAFVQMMSVAYMMDNPQEVKIVAEKGYCGKVFINLIPTDQKGEKDLSCEQDEDEEHFDNPFDLLKQNLYCKVKIGKAEFVDKCWKDVFCTYKLKTQQLQKSELNQTKIIPGMVQGDVEFDYECVHAFEKLNNTQIQYILNKTICFEFYAMEQRIVKLADPVNAIDIDEELDIDLIKFKQNKKHQGIIKQVFSFQLNFENFENQENIKEENQVLDLGQDQENLLDFTLTKNKAGPEMVYKKPEKKYDCRIF